ncbi:hypothetical protein BS17DRAFT_571580 [Gyrodon lividus]|nr:hypothetical protein BS17DRAFT_571580 [Gyrodon lividus]
MPSQFQVSPYSILLFVCLTCHPFLLSILSLSPEIKVHPVLRFLLIFMTWWLSYWSARSYIRLAEKSSPLYHPLGCLAQCFNWVLHWVQAVYHAFFVNRYSLPTYMTTIFCVVVVIFSEGLFHSLITIDCKNTENLGVYEDARKSFGRSLVTLIRIWYSSWEETSPRRRKRARMPARSQP